VISVSEIQRQRGSYKRAVEALRDGKMEEGLNQLDRMGWIQEVPEEDRYRLLAADYLKAVSAKKKGGSKTALVVSPTHQEAGLVTQAIRDGLRQAKKLGEDRDLPVWVAAHLTEAERKEACSYAAGDLLQFHRPAKGVKSGARLVVKAGEKLPLEAADRFAVYRPATLQVAAGDTLRVTANGKSKDGHRLDNGMLLKVKGFSDTGDLVTDKGWMIAKDWGHLAHGYCVTSHAAQGKTVDQVLIAQSAVSAPASSREQFYVSVSRGKSKATVYCFDKEALKDAIGRSESRLTASELVGIRKPAWRKRHRKHLSVVRRMASLTSQPGTSKQWEREAGHE
jgi:plastocyanin